MRNMAFSMTKAQIRARTKRVTRRFGWWFLKKGDYVRPVEKGMGLMKGEHPVTITGPLRIVSTRPEPLNAITQAECILEGFPELTPEQFVAMMVKHRRCRPDETVNRIEFKYTYYKVKP